MSLRSKHTFWVPKSLIPIPPRSLVVQQFSQATKHLAEDVLVWPAHMKALLLLSISLMIAGGMLSADMAYTSWLSRTELTSTTLPIVFKRDACQVDRK